MVNAPLPGKPVFKDENFEKRIRTVLKKETEEITPEDMAGLTSLKVVPYDITDLTGIEFCVNLKELDISALKKLKDLSPIRGLTSLEILNLNHIDNNKNDQSEYILSDLSPIAGLINLRELYLSMNYMTDAGALGKLTSLEKLDLSYNKLEDISFISSLTNLKVLSLFFNNISDLSPLAGLTELNFLNAALNKITSVEPLRQLSNLETIEIGSNQIKDYEPLDHIKNRKFKGEQSWPKTDDNGQMAGFVWELLKFIYTFWNGVWKWFNDHPVPPFLNFLVVDFGMQAWWHTGLLLLLYVIVYLSFCKLAIFVAKIPYNIIDRHMQNHDSHILMNLWLYIAAIGFSLFDSLVFKTGTKTADGKVSIGIFTIIALLLVVIGFIRLIIVSKWRAIYFMPLQIVVFAVFYVYLLVWFPAIVVLLLFQFLCGLVTSSGDGGKCPHCGNSISKGVDACPHCGTGLTWE
jgi:hypothetical protein